MTVFQLIMVSIWGLVYLILTGFTVKDMINGEFVEKNKKPNLLTPAWIAITIAGSIILTVISFVLE